MSTEIKTKTERPDVLTTIALRKLGLAPPYKSCGWEVTPGGLIVYVKDTFIKSRGKNKGKRGWRGPRLKCFVGNSEIDAEELAWEVETGKCHKCGGDGQQFQGWHRDHGTTYRTCTRCGGNGQPPIIN